MVRHLRKWKTRLVQVILGLVLILLIIGSVPKLRSLVVMGLVTFTQSLNAVGLEEGIRIEFIDPGHGDAQGLNWFSQMILFNQSSVSFERLGLEGKGEAELSIYYTFGDFKAGHATIYDVDSPYNSAFYGAYVIKLKPENPLENENALENRVSINDLTEAVTRYDYTRLILAQLGLDIEKAYFNPEVGEIRSNLTMFDSDSWTMTDAIIQTRSVTHVADGFLLHYLQFGKSKSQHMDEAFPELTLYGRTYSKYFSEEEIYVIFYIQTPDKALLEKTDEILLSKSKVMRRPKTN